ncbi:CHRD domain-containing protein [Hymenobacter nivis]|uniref:CHRD domain-containing protein n=1 Tax=Hymenobacter nivis TaxID=1850093 RepID=A0A502GUR6_9BACT|nr:CHRD domain-containing protein [Hymenobacter nivis]TPG65969.1 CHRD domain-containing protein [Hymenobacter nivis]
MKKIFSSLLLLAGLAAATSCAKDETVAPVITTASSTLTGAQEAPTPNSSAATGSFTGSYNQTTMMLTYTVTFTGLAPTMGHLHIGAPGTAGPVSVPFTPNNTAGTGFVSPITGTVKLDQTQATALLGKSMYANLHTTTFPNGEIRGDITTK